jgi:hypothetical protein
MHSPNVFLHLILSRAKPSPFAPTSRFLAPSTPVDRAKDLNFPGHVRVLVVPTEICLAAKGDTGAGSVEALEFATGCDVADDRVGDGGGKGGAPTTFSGGEKGGKQGVGWGAGQLWSRGWVDVGQSGCARRHGNCSKHGIRNFVELSRRRGVITLMVCSCHFVRTGHMLHEVEMMEPPKKIEFWGQSR